jgi:hypothetical protein
MGKRLVHGFFEQQKLDHFMPIKTQRELLLRHSNEPKRILQTLTSSTHRYAKREKSPRPVTQGVER